MSRQNNKERSKEKIICRLLIMLRNEIKVDFNLICQWKARSVCHIWLIFVFISNIFKQFIMLSASKKKKKLNFAISIVMHPSHGHFNYFDLSVWVKSFFLAHFTFKRKPSLPLKENLLNNFAHLNTSFFVCLFLLPACFNNYIWLINNYTQHFW